MITNRTTYIQNLIKKALPGETVVLPKGVHSVALYIDKSLTLTSDGDVSETSLKGIKDGGSVIVIVEDGLDITLENITIMDGFDLKGGGISVRGSSKLTIRNCTIQNNGATYYGGGGIYIANGELSVIRSRIIKNAAIIGGGVLVDGGAQAIFKSSLIVENGGQRGGGGICLKESAVGEILNCTLADNFVVEETGKNIYLWGSITDQPSVKIMNSVLAEREDGNSITVGDCGGNVEIFHTMMSSGHRESLTLKIDKMNLYAPIFFESSQGERYLLNQDSPGITLGNPEFLRIESKDLLGKKWLSGIGSKVSVGAYSRHS